MYKPKYYLRNYKFTSLLFFFEWNSWWKISGFIMEIQFLEHEKTSWHKPVTKVAILITVKQLDMNMMIIRIQYKNNEHIFIKHYSDDNYLILLRFDSDLVDWEIGKKRG